MISRPKNASKCDKKWKDNEKARLSSMTINQRKNNEEASEMLTLTRMEIDLVDMNLDEYLSIKICQRRDTDLGFTFELNEQLGCTRTWWCACVSELRHMKDLVRKFNAPSTRTLDGNEFVSEGPFVKACFVASSTLQHRLGHFIELTRQLRIV